MKYIIGVDVDSVLRDFPHDLVRVIKREHPEWYNEEYPVQTNGKWRNVLMRKLTK